MLASNCRPLANARVDVWHCDAQGAYSEYGGNRFQPDDYSNAHFLRGRQTTDTEGQMSFISLYPGWYPGRAPHIHVEVLSNTGQSLLVSQIAFPDEVSQQVYTIAHYPGAADTASGNAADGYIITKVLTVETYINLSRGC